MTTKHIGIIGSGVGGLGAAIRLAVKGYKVTVFEKNKHAGGKINNLQLGDYRFDMGPSVFTGPEYMKELYDLCNEDFNTFQYTKLAIPFHYFFSDGTKMKISADRKELVNEMHTVLGEDKTIVENYLNKAASNYKLIAPLFIENSLHKCKPLKNRKTLKALLHIADYKLGKTMNEENVKTFVNPKTVQLFNRFATYNGSDPYQAPAMLNMIQHLEMNEGVYLPDNGMVQIANSLYDLALKNNVQFNFEEEALLIQVDNNNNIKGLTTNKDTYKFDAVFSNMDLSLTYEKLLPHAKHPKKLLRQEKSSSAIVFYWGINKTFDELAVHNMLFSSNYKQEFEAIFKHKTHFDDPSVYIHITSKHKSEDAPNGKENWFVMINVPENIGQDWSEFKIKAKQNVILKINKLLKCSIENHIEEEFIMDPVFVENQYYGKGGSIYGNASNSKYAAFYRHPNFSKTIKGLYFCGVTVHPGGGIPLALNSAKIAVNFFEEIGD
jgi:phytoene desaturase